MCGFGGGIKNGGPARLGGSSAGSPTVIAPVKRADSLPSREDPRISLEPPLNSLKTTRMSEFVRNFRRWATITFGGGA